jgi:iron complex transport system substrate-binding protein
MSTRTRIAAATAVAAAVALLAGCAGGSTPATSSSSDGALGSVETMFGTVEIPQPKDGDLKVVALGWSDAETALALGVVPIAVYDWGGFGEASKGVGPWATSEFGDTTPTIIERGDQSLNYEQISALSPDLILNTRSSNDEAEYQRLSEIAPTVYGPAGTGAFATEWRDQVALIGAATGHADDATKLVADIDGEIADAKAANPDFAGKTVSSVAKFGDAYGAYLPGDGRFDLLAELGFVNSPAVAALPSNGFFASVSVENVTALDADAAVILPIGFTLAETQADPLLASLGVVSGGHAVFLDPTSELAGAWGASSPLSIPVVLKDLVPQLATAVAAK